MGHQTVPSGRNSASCEWSLTTITGTTIVDPTGCCRQMVWSHLHCTLWPPRMESSSVHLPGCQWEVDRLYFRLQPDKRRLESPRNSFLFRRTAIGPQRIMWLQALFGANLDDKPMSPANRRNFWSGNPETTAKYIGSMHQHYQDHKMVKRIDHLYKTHNAWQDHMLGNCWQHHQKVRFVHMVIICWLISSVSTKRGDNSKIIVEKQTWYGLRFKFLCIL